MDMAKMEAAQTPDSNAQLTASPCCRVAASDARPVATLEGAPVSAVVLVPLARVEVAAIPTTIARRIASESPPGACGVRATLTRHCSFLI